MRMTFGLGQIVPVGLLAGSLCYVTGLRGGAAEPTGAPAPSLSALQEQIDALRTNQQRILQELGEIRALLAEKDHRAEVAVKPPPATTIRLNLHGEPFRGATNARIAVIEYSDFDCSHCAKFAAEVFPRFQHRYLDGGKVRYYFRDLVGPADAQSLEKARIARCAGEQGKFWEMHDRLFMSQNLPPAEQSPVALAQSLQLDTTQFSACLTSPRYVDAIAQISANARKMGIIGTPSFLIGTLSPDGIFFQAVQMKLGGEKFEEVEALLEELLKANP